MPSTYTTNLGIEKIATGEQSGTWGTTTNTNFDLIDTAVNGIVSITLASAGTSGSPNDLPITDGTASNGRNKFIEFVDGGDLGATAYVQLTPNDAEKIVHIRNSLSGSRSIIVFQGTYNASNDFEIPNGADVTLKFDGAGTGATVADVNVDLTVTGVTATSTASFSGATIDDLGTVTTADINGGTIDGTVIGGSSAAAGTFTTFTSTGIDDNATSTAITIDSSENVGIGETSPDAKLHVTGTTSDYGILAEQPSGYGGFNLKSTTVNQTWSFFAQDNASNSDLHLYGGSSAGIKMTIDSSGNVGIGTSDPSSFSIDTGPDIILGDGTDNPHLSIVSPTTGTGYVAFADGTAGTAKYSGLIEYAHSTDHMGLRTGGTERMRIDSSGNVGIGTASPANTLHVETSGNTGIQLRSGTASYGNINFNDGASAKGQILYDHNGDYMRLYVNSAERMRIDSGGNLLVGKTTTATSTVGGVWSQSGVLQTTTDGSVALYLNRETSDGSILEFRKDNTTVGSIGTEGGDLAIGNDDAGIQFVNCNEHFRPFSMASNASTDGLMDIGSSSKRFKDLYLSGGVNFDGASGNTLYKSGSDLILTNRAAATLIVGTSNTERMRIDSSGNVIIGNTSATFNNTAKTVIRASDNYYIKPSVCASFNRTGTDGNILQFYKAGTFVGSISVTTSATAYNTSSDVRLKENIVDAPAGNIDAIRVRSFDWKADGTHQTYGMIAQELVDVAPEAVSQGATDDDMWAVDYSKLVPMMIKEIQDLRARVAQLEGA